MLILAIDTTTNFGSAAVVSEGKIIAEANYLSPSSHSRQLFQAVDEVIKISGKKLDDFDGLAVVAGPGSFTGIRIGLSLIKSLAMASKKPIAPVSSLQALAQKLILPGVELISPMIDARKGEIYACAYKVFNSEVEELISPGAYNPEAFLKMLPDNSAVYLIGNGVDLYWPLIKEKLGERARLINRSYFIAAEAGRLGEKVLENGKGVTPAQLEPIYYRKSQAEEGKSGKK